MKGLRIIGLMFSGFFALGLAIIGYAFAQTFLNLQIFRVQIGQDLPGYQIIAPIGFCVIGALVGFLVGSMLYRRIVDLGRGLRRIPAEDKIASTFGTIISLIVASFLFWLFNALLPHSPLVTFSIVLLVTVAIVWLGNIIALSMKEELKFFLPGMANASRQPVIDTSNTATSKILDTNVIIDGRIYDVCRSGFLEGTVLLPGFVLEELQYIADSADPLRRNRGRRGLDILYQMQKELDTTVRVMDRYKVAFAPGDGVDIKLVKLAKSMGNADLVTNDYNLNKVAKLHGVRVLNVNELANAMKPIVLPGEEMTINIVREGKEYNQGVGYLDDGTMVVVEGGKKMMGETVTVAVSSVLQTVAGKMIFAELSGDHAPEVPRRAQR